MQTDRPHRFLIIRFSAIGDIILTTPIVRSLRKKYPDAEINFLVKKKYRSLLENSPHLNNILEYDPSAEEPFSRFVARLNLRTYDGIIDLQSNNRSLFIGLAAGSVKTARFNHHRLRRFLLVRLGIDLYTDEMPVPERFLKAASPWGVRDDGKGLELFISRDAASAVSAGLAKTGITGKKRYIVLAPGAGRATKRWLETGFAETGAHFIQTGYSVLLAGSSDDADICQRIKQLIDSDKAVNMCGMFSLQQTAALLKEAALVITNDTGVMHMSCGVDTPVTVLFGPTSRQLGFYPFRARAAVVEQELQCRPCSYHGDKKCPKGHFRCMREITSARVITAAEKLIN